MDFLLLIILGAGLIYLWRKTDALEERIRQFEDIVEGLNFQLSRSGPRSADTPDAEVASEIESKPEVAPAPAQSEPPKFIPAARAVPISQEKAEPAAAMPLQAETASATEQVHKEPKTPRFQIDFEDIFGRLLPIWAGGVALAVAGFFLVRYSIEQGLLGPQVRVALSFVFGGLLLGGAEIAYRQEHRIADPRVRQALAGAGLATLYASFYLAGSHYGMIGSAVAFLGLAGVTGAAILLSFRFGLPSAILGLVGGFAAPMLVDSQEPNVPILALYLALVTGGLTYAGNRQGRSWLALGALAAGLGWGALMLFTGLTGTGDLLAVGGYLVVLGAVVPALTKHTGRTADVSPFIRIGAAALAALQMAVMVEQAGFSLLAWALYGLLGAALSFFAFREPRLREAVGFAAAIAVLMLGLWPDVSASAYIIVGLGIAVIFIGVPLANTSRGAQRDIDVFQLGGVSLGLIAVTFAQFAGTTNLVLLGLVCFAIALLPALAAWLLWPARKTNLSLPTLFAVATSAIGIAAAALIASPEWFAPVVVAVTALGVIALGWARQQDSGSLALAWSGAIAGLTMLLVTQNFVTEFALLFGVTDVDYFGREPVLWQSILRWTAVAATFAALALRQRTRIVTSLAEVLSVLMVYGIASQLMPASVLAWLAAGIAVTLAVLQTERNAARFTAVLVTLGWAMQPIVIWLVGAGGAVFAEPMLIAGDITWSMIGLQMAPLIVALSALLWKPSAFMAKRLPVIGVGVGAIAIIGVHAVYKQMFALNDLEQFVAMGVLERTMWQALLVGAGYAVMRFAADRQWAKPVSTGLFITALAHFLLFSFGWHNPLWAEQAVGALPIANLLIPSYAAGIAAVLLLERAMPPVRFVQPWMYSSILMVLISFLALSELRHVFAGSILISEPVMQTEDLLRSLLGIILAIGFLLWGARSSTQANTRSWRIGSLVLILMAVIKVFAFDTAGLEGLARIASFMALGFSLIGIGWFYTRQLSASKPSGTDNSADGTENA